MVYSHQQLAGAVIAQSAGRSQVADPLDVPLVDSHCHLNFEKYAADVDAVISRSLAAGMKLIVPSSQLATSRWAVELAQKHDGIYAAVGLHPIHVDDEPFDRQAYENLAGDPRVVGIGEVGLDYYHVVEPTELAEEKIKQRQIELFSQFLDLAEDVGKPVIMHCRDAYDELLDFLEKRRLKVPSVIHCYIGSEKQWQKFLDFGSYMGFTGIITFKNCSSDLLELVKKTPLDRLLIETDAPYLAPEPHRGQRNEPLFVEFVARRVAELKGISYEQVVEATAQNAGRLFNIE